MNPKMHLICLAAALSAAVPAFAKTTTWKGGGTGKFSVADNWDNGAPAPGDTAVVKRIVCFEAETFDFGADGITIDNSALLSNKVVFAGSGKLIKKGTGDFRPYSKCTHTGGTKIENGRLQFYDASVKGVGTGEIEVTRVSSSMAELRYSAYATDTTNAIHITGDSLYAPFYCHNKATVRGPIRCDCDTQIGSGYGGFCFYSSFALPGHTLKVNSVCGYSSSFNATLFYGPIDGNVEVMSSSTAPVRMYATNPGADNSLSVYGCTNFLESAASWAGTNILVSGSKSVLVLRSAGNLSAEAVIRLASGGKLVVDQTAAVRELWIDGVRQADGSYMSGDLSDRLAGCGLLTVGAAAGVKTWVGGAKGTFDKAENWSPSGTPVGGDTLVFPDTETTVTGATYTVEAPGVTIVNSAKLNFQLRLTGAGSFTKVGAGDFVLGVGNSTCGWKDYSGDIYLKSGVFKAQEQTNPKALGTGKLWLNIAADMPAKLNFPSWGCGLSNPIEVIGSRVGSPIVITQSNSIEVHNTVTADNDITLEAWWGPLAIEKTVSAPGHTVSFKNAREPVADKNGPIVKVNAPVDAHMCLTGPGPITVSSKSTGVDDTLTIDNGTNTLTSAAAWAGTNVVVAPLSSAKTAVLRLQGNDNLARDAMVSVSGIGKIIIDAKVRIRIAGLKLGSTLVPTGIYRPADYPDYLDGTGTLVVGRPGCVILLR